MKNKLIAIAILGVLLANIAYAEVGVGVSPSKAVLQVEGGKTQELELLVFNSGDQPMEISLVVEGDIKDFTQVSPASIVIEPEPMPHALPIKNGQSFSIKFTPPPTGTSVTYKGTIAATGTPSGNSQFGGSVAVATQIELIVTPTASLLSYLKPTDIALIFTVLVIIILIVILRKAGISLKIEKKK